MILSNATDIRYGSNQSVATLQTQNQLSFFGNSPSVTLTRAITGSRSLEKYGNHTLTLSGNNTYTGTTSISGGTLSVLTFVSNLSGKLSKVDFTPNSLSATFVANPASAESYKIFNGATIQSYPTVTLIGAPSGISATYNSSTSTLYIGNPFLIRVNTSLT